MASMAPAAAGLNPYGRKSPVASATPGMVTNDATGPALTPLPGGSHRLQPGGEQPQPTGPGTAPTTPQPTPPAPTQANPTTIAAADDPRLTALNDRYNSYLDDFDKGTGKALDQAGAKFRDAREGARSAMSNDAAFRGVNADTGNFDASTLRGEQGAIADEATKREAEKGENLRGGLAIAGAPGSANRQDRQLNLDLLRDQENQSQQTWENSRDTANDAWSKFLAMLGQARQGPLPPGTQLPSIPGMPSLTPTYSSPGISTGTGARHL